MWYEQQIKEMAGLETGIIEIKKKKAYEKDSASKVFMIFMIEDEAQSIDQTLHKTEFKGF